MKWRLLLWPFSLIYAAVTGLRNLGYNRGIFKSNSYDIPIIAVGNLSTGGTGKTPMIEYLIRLLHDFSLGMVSRGYGRKSRGLIMAAQNSTAAEIGDEPLQVQKKFPQLKVAVSERRCEGIEALLRQKCCDVLLLDDAFQHRSITAGMQILLTTYNSPYFQDLVLPAGNLRESRLGRKRAHIIILTKCPPDLGRGDAEHIRRKLKAGTEQKVFFSTVEYKDAINHKQEKLEAGSKVLVLSGIAHPELFLRYAKKHFQVQRHLRFPDHHSFRSKDMARIEELLSEDPKLCLLTTEKDWVRLPEMKKKYLNRIYYQPIQTVLLFNEEERLRFELLEFIENFEQKGSEDRLSPS